MRDLIEEYKKSLKTLRKIKENAPEEDRKILGSMESDLRYCLQWMTSARRPGCRRGVERLAAYQREKPFDPILIQQYFYSIDIEEGISSTLDPYEMIDSEPHNMISESDKDRLEDVLSILSPLERDVYLMARGRCISRREIAKMMGLEKGTINKLLKRSEIKIQKHIKNSLFCLPNAT